jgi:hypothetical protein
MFSVTEVLGPWSNYGNVPPTVLKEASERGDRVHAACLAFITGAYLVTPLPEKELLYLESFKAWSERYIDKVECVEKEFINQLLGFYGHPDIVCTTRTGKKKSCVIDIKTPQQEQKTWVVQVSAYQNLTNAHESIALMLDANGGQAKAIYGNPVGFSIFLNALNAYRYFKS